MDLGVRPTLHVLRIDGVCRRHREAFAHHGPYNHWAILPLRARGRLMTRLILADGKLDLRLGDQHKVLADVEGDALIDDPPYSARTHAGALDATTLERGVNGYTAWTEVDAIAYLESWEPRIRSWMVIQTDDVLGPVMRSWFDARGRYTFPLVPVLQQQPRVTGDGPGSPGHFLVVARPREKRFLSWGSLPCWYEAPRDGSFVRGGKPLGLMRKIVAHYSSPGDRVVVPHGGAFTTPIAALLEGRTAVSSEIDPATFAVGHRRAVDGNLAARDPRMLSLFAGGDA